MRSEPPHDPAELPRLILSIQDIFAAKKVERLTTTELCDALNKEEEGGWAQINHGRGVDAYWLREKLADVVPNDEGWEKKRRWTVGGKKRHGYTRAHFDDAIKRYLPREASKTVESSGPSGPIEEKADRSMTPRTGWRGPDRKTAKVDPAHPAQETERRAGWTGCKTTGIRSGPAHPALEMVNRQRWLGRMGRMGRIKTRKWRPLRGKVFRCAAPADGETPPTSLLTPTTARPEEKPVHDHCPSDCSSGRPRSLPRSSVLRDRKCPCDDARRRNPG